jgi:hypothetical protein
MRRLALLLAIGVASCASPEVVSHTPRGIEIDCMGGLTCSSSPQALANTAQEHCRQYGQNAQQDGLTESASGRRWVRYKCVP